MKIKLNLKLLKCVFIGYIKRVEGYTLFNTKIKKVCCNKDVVFYEEGNNNVIFVHMNDFPTPFQNDGDSYTRENHLQPIDIVQTLTTLSKVEHVVPY
jgi:hypothetical protein